MKRKHQRMRHTRRKKSQSGQLLATHKQTGPRTLDEFFAMSERDQDLWLWTTHVVSEMRADLVSLRQASRGFGLNPRTAIRLGGSALHKDKNGRYKARASDRLFRPMLVLTRGGPREVGIRDSRVATLVAEHWNAAHRYLETGDKSVRRKFRGKSFIDASGNKVRLMTDLEELSRQGNAGNLSFESIYPK